MAGGRRRPGYGHQPVAYRARGHLPGSFHRQRAEHRRRGGFQRHRALFLRPHSRNRPARGSDRFDADEPRWPHARAARESERAGQRLHRQFTRVRALDRVPKLDRLGLLRRMQSVNLQADYEFGNGINLGFNYGWQGNRQVLAFDSDRTQVDIGFAYAPVVSSTRTYELRPRRGAAPALAGGRDLFHVQSRRQLRRRRIGAMALASGGGPAVGWRGADLGTGYQPLPRQRVRDGQGALWLGGLGRAGQPQC